MAPRPRTIDDAAILYAAGRIISRQGPAKFTLADIAAEVGLSPATLVQRFGSKRGLMLALARSARDSVEACFDLVRASNPSPLAALLAAATEMTRYVNSPEEMSNHLAFLQTDLSDPDFYGVTLENSHRILAGYRRLLDEAVAARELVPCDTARLARAVDAVAGGSLIGWAVYREGTAESWVRTDLDTLLEPYRPKTTTTARASNRSPATSKKTAKRRSRTRTAARPR
jgi:AcrR family transcriptional regulator